ncbi:MAG: hypothetical protein KatS3mg104_2149 [Phycisphaerae bacterium]|nr:MAG: hypothetical protein KatS3mg104_2149 [Phycisphaerae bacterium]
MYDIGQRHAPQDVGICESESFPFRVLIYHTNQAQISDFSETDDLAPDR